MVQDANRLVVFGSQLVGVLIVIVGLWTQEANLQSPRPVGTKTPTSLSTSGSGDRFAHLWDDPFPDTPPTAEVKPPPRGPSPKPAPASTEPESAAPLSSNTEPTPSESASSSPAKQPDKCKKLLIWNLVDARQVAEMKERRLRIRYAAVSAVLGADFLPLRDSLLSPLTGKSPTSGGPEGKKLIGYFETFKGSPKCKALFQRVILVWTPKELLLGQAIDGELIKDIKRQIDQRDNEPADGEVDVRILHHGTSQDLEDYDESAHPDLKGKISFMRATIAGKKFDRFRPIISDDRLIEALFEELSLRIPALNTPREEKDRPRIVVVAERDTRYSQAIKEQLGDKFEGCARLEFYSYLRGLDGRSEDASSTADSTKPENPETANDNRKGGGFQERSLGTSQFDYLRRLAVELDEQISSRKSRAASAVGILGSDIYDKMLVLQALQPVLPGAIFFTTDLDALYLERGNQDYTRNLVVAGLDSLIVNSSLPPMRDSYQTLLARKVSELVGLPDFRSTNAPHVFEIAPGKLVELGPERGQPAEAPAGYLVLQFLSRPAHLPPWDSLLRFLSQPAHTPAGDSVLQFLASQRNMIIFWVALVNAFVILAAIFTREAKPDPKRRKAMIASMAPWARRFVYTEVFLGLLGILILLVFLGVWKNALLLGEPLALGVSLWPSVMIRLLAFIVAILFLLIASYNFVLEGPTIREKLELALDERMQNIQFHLPEGVAREGMRLCRSVAAERPELPPLQRFQPQLEKFFGMERLGRPRTRRFWQIVGVSMIYFLVTGALFALWPPSVPGRGAFALLTEKIVLALGISLYIIHLIFCLDLHRTAFNFLRTLRAIYLPENWERIERKRARIKARQMLEATSEFTSIIGKTLLYPLTVLILIILSRLRQFDNWTMTPSLAVTFLGGAVALITASLVLWAAGTRLKKEVLARHAEAEEAALGELLQAAAIRQPSPPTPAEEKEAEIREKRDAAARAALTKEREELEAVNQGVFAAWYNQPIFAALFSAAAVFGSVSIAGPLARLFF